jgi:hypothetical protein
MGRELVVEAPENSPFRAGVVVLDEGDLFARRLTEDASVPTFEEEATLVVETGWLE